MGWFFGFKLVNQKLNLSHHRIGQRPAEEHLTDRTYPPSQPGQLPGQPGLRVDCLLPSTQETILEQGKSLRSPFQGLSITHVNLRYMLRRRHRRALEAIFRRPTQSVIRWDDIESLFLACGAYIEELDGSKLAVEINDTTAIFHRPHPRPDTDKGALEAVLRFLIRAGIAEE